MRKSLGWTIKKGKAIVKRDPKQLEQVVEIMKKRQMKMVFKQNEKEQQMKLEKMQDEELARNAYKELQIHKKEREKAEQQEAKRE